MSEEAHPRPRRWPDWLRWGACFAFVLCFHVAGAVALLASRGEDSNLMPNAPVILVDLAPVAAAPTITPTDMPPDVVQSAEAEPQPEPEPETPVEKIEIPPMPVPEPELAVMPPPKPIEKLVEKKPKQKHASIARAAPTAEREAERAAAPMAGANSNNPNAMRTWQSELVSRLERYKRYPTEARGASGVAHLAFSVDRQGGVHHARITRSSGSSALDEATLALVARAAPLPPPPPEVAGPQIAIAVPIRYNTR